MLEAENDYCASLAHIALRDDHEAITQILFRQLDSCELRGDQR